MEKDPDPWVQGEELQVSQWLGESPRALLDYLEAEPMHMSGEVREDSIMEQRRVGAYLSKGSCALLCGVKAFTVVVSCHMYDVVGKS